MLASRLDLIEPSPTLAIAAQVQALKANGADIIGFGAGEPDFDTPMPVREAAIAAISDGFTRYTAGAGIIELREAISEKLLRENRIPSDPDNIVVTCGAKQAIYNALMAICNPGDEIVLIAPFWPTYREQVLLAGGVPVVVKTEFENDYCPTYEQLSAAVSKKTKAIIINSPCNPTGTVFNRNTLKEIAALALKHKFCVISDEIYERHLYDGVEHVSIASLGKDISDLTITVSGVSKTYAMTGWRIGYSHSQKQIARAMTTIQDQVTSHAPSISQKAALTALRLPRAVVEAMVCEFDKRRKHLLQLLSRVSGVKYTVPRGAFYVLADFSAATNDRVKNDIELAQYLLEAHAVACIPGSAFYAPGNLRLTYATGLSQITEGMRRISEGLQSLK